ncbi:MAG: glycoside hydrolase family 2 TIM barrel-domain containing protein [Bacteroidia bacterium]|nr:glycoside hydrolase family 2 TIM barrel-domain containing protein [Bacteroidia bacterium]
MTCSLFSQEERSLSLDGAWEIIFDEHNEGREADWMKDKIFSNHASKEFIQLPIAWETIKQDYEGVAFYRKEFEVPADWENKLIRLHFGAVNYLSEVWINDEVVGYHEGGFSPFEFRVDEMIKVGEKNVVTLRVVGPLFLSDKEIDGMKALETPQWRGGISGGIWQSVQLLASEQLYIDDVYIQPNIQNNTASIQVLLDYTGIQNKNIELQLNIYEVNESSEVGLHKEIWELHSGKNQHSWTLPIPKSHYWSPDDPFLYRLEVTTHIDGEMADSWSGRFGMRALTIKDKDFYLNGKKIYLKASFFEGLYPNGIAHPDSKEMIRKEIQMAKDAGFNLIRPWRRPPVPLWLDLADEMGVLVVGSPALECMQLPFSTPYLPMRVENEVRQAILRDRNRACIIQWELFNELHRPVLKQMMRPMAMLARELDPSRLILDESGGWAFGANMYLPYEYEATKFNDIHNYPGPFINKDRYDGYLSIGMTEEEKKRAGYTARTPGRNVLPGLMSYVSELGYGSLPDLTVNNEKFAQVGNPLTPAFRYHKRLHEGQVRILEESNFKYLYPDMQKFYLEQQLIHGTANKRMIEAVRANPEVDGYCIHALVAGDWIMGAGLMDLWRNPKSYAYEGTKAANQPRILSIRSIPRNIYAEKGSKIEIIGINEKNEIATDLCIEVLSEKGKKVYSQKLEKNWEEGVSTLFNHSLNSSRMKGSYQIKAKILDSDGNLLAENSTPIDVFRSKDLQSKNKEVLIHDEQGNLSRFLEQRNITLSELNSSSSISLPLLVSGNPANFEDALLEQILQHSKKGGKTVFIEGFANAFQEENSKFPFQARVHPSVGLWTCIPHLIREHPIFKGLPSNEMMKDIYENVWANRTLRNLKAEDGKLNVLVGSMGFDWFSREHKMHYSGPGEEWWGSDVAELSYGKGSIIFSQLRLVEHLGKDPVADKILLNLLNYLTP